MWLLACGHGGPLVSVTTVLPWVDPRACVFVGVHCSCVWCSCGVRQAKSARLLLSGVSCTSRNLVGCGRIAFAEEYTSSFDLTRVADEWDARHRRIGRRPTRLVDWSTVTDRV